MDDSRRFTSWNHVIDYATNQINALGKWEEINGKKSVAARKRRGSLGFRFTNPIEKWQMDVIREAEERGLPLKWHMDNEGFYNHTFKLSRKLTFRQAAWWHVAYLQARITQTSPMFYTSSPKLFDDHIKASRSYVGKKTWKRWEWNRRIAVRAKKRLEEEHLSVRSHGRDEYTYAVRCAKEKLCFFEFDFGHVLLDTTWRRVFTNRHMKSNHLRGGYVHVLLNSVPIAIFYSHEWEAAFGSFRGDWQRRCIIDSFKKARIPLPEDFKYQYKAQRNIQAALREVSK
jgi:hypothetical protein